MTKTQPITFPVVEKIATDRGVRTIRRNAETGVEIWSGESGLGDRVMVPSRIEPNGGLVHHFTAYRNLALARAHAADCVADMRLAIEMAHAEGLFEDAERAAEDLADRLDREHKDALIAAEQNDAWRARHPNIPAMHPYWTYDAFEADHAEALAMNEARDDLADRSVIGIESTCVTCGETFNPANETDEHFARADGTPCGGAGHVEGVWLSTTDVTLGAEPRPESAAPSPDTLTLEEIAVIRRALRSQFGAACIQLGVTGYDRLIAKLDRLADAYVQRAFS